MSENDIRQTDAAKLSVIDDRSKADVLVAGRQCGPCTACCTVLVVVELHKPARWACDHVSCQGCGIYENRPHSCRDFNCAWLSGEIPGDESLRPDKLGLMFDYFYSTAANKARSVVFELWNGACNDPQAAALLCEIAASRKLELSYRDGTWRTIGMTGLDEQ